MGSNTVPLMEPRPEDIKGVDHTLDRQLFHLKTLHEASQELGELRESHAIINSLLMMLMGALGAVSGVVLLADTHQCRIAFKETRGCDDVLLEERLDRLKTKSFKDFAEIRNAVVLDLAVENSNHRNELHEALSSFGMHLWVSFAVDEALKGGVALGDKLLGEAYTVEDYELLLTLCSQGAVHIANSRLIEQLQKRVFHLRTLYDVSQEITFLNDLQEILNQWLLMVAGTFGAVSGLVFLADLKQRKVEYAVHKGLDDAALEALERLTTSGHLLELCVMDGIASQEPTGDAPAHASSLLSLLQLPIWIPFTVNDQLRGGIGLGERLIEEPYNAEDQELLSTLAAQGAVCIQNAKLIEQIRKEEILRTNLSRYISPQIVDQIVKKDVQVNLGGQRKVVTVLFSDLRDFTTMTESQDPDKLVKILNEYFTEMVRTIFKHQGIIDKFVGDAIIAVFGSLIELPHPAQNATQAAIAMMNKMPELNRRWQQRYGLTLHMGIGIATGEVFLGNIGSPERMEFTVIGDTVNVASRFSGLARAGQILVTRPLAEQLPSDISYYQLPLVRVKGKKEDMVVFEILYDSRHTAFSKQLPSTPDNKSLDPHIKNINSPLFEGLAQDVLDDIWRHMKPCLYQPNEFICRQGETGDSVFIIQSGLVEIFIDQADAPVVLDRLRRGDILGEMALITGEPRTANAVAIMPTEVLELKREAFSSIIAHHPHVLFNISNILIQRQKRSNLSLVKKQHRGEIVAIIMGQHTSRLLTEALNVIQRENPKNLAVIDLTGALAIDTMIIDRPSTATILGKLDDLLVDYKTVLAVLNATQHDIDLLIRNMDRVELVAEPQEALPLYQRFKETAKQIHCILVQHESSPAARGLDHLPVVRTLSSTPRHIESAWLSRHLTRRKIGLALGAGGAKGYAHVGALSVFEQAGIPIDYLSGSSIGAMVGSFLADGMKSAAIATELNRIWSPKVVSELSAYCSEGHSIGLRHVMQLAAEVVEGRTFSGLHTPLTIMTADLSTQRAAPISEGPLAEALCAGITIPGMVPPYIRGSQRLVDGIAIIPVPVAAVRDAGADLVISINLLHRKTLPAWPGVTASPAPPKSSRLADPVIETLVMLQLDTSIRNAAEADLVLTPPFPPLSWRDFHVGELIEEAGRRAVQEQLPAILDLVRH